MFGNEIETQIFAVAASLCGDVRRVGPGTGAQRRDHTLSRRTGRRQPTASAGVWDELSASAQLLVSVSVWE